MSVVVASNVGHFVGAHELALQKTTVLRKISSDVPSMHYIGGPASLSVLTIARQCPIGWRRLGWNVAR